VRWGGAGSGGVGGGLVGRTQDWGRVADTVTDAEPVTDPASVAVTDPASVAVTDPASVAVTDPAPVAVTDPAPVTESKCAHPRVRLYS